MNKENIEKALNTLVGKVYEPSEIGKVVSDLFENDHHDLKEQGYYLYLDLTDRRSKYHELNIFKHNDKNWGWSSKGLIVVEIERTRDLLGNYYFKSARVCFNYKLNKNDFDLTEQLAFIESEMQKSKDIKQNEFKEILNEYNKVKLLLGDKTKRVLEYFYKHGYSLERGYLDE